MGTPLPESVPAVIARLRAIEESAPPSDGVVCFARLYREVTEGVGDELASQSASEGEFLERLDVGFAGLFFSAFDAFERGAADVPSAWVPLFSERSRRGVAPLQFALAGVNAHINRDLPVALVDSCRELAVDIFDVAPDHATFERVNVLLGQVEQKLKALYLTGWLRAVDRLLHRFHRLDDVIAMWDVTHARDAAWTNGRTLWGLRGSPPLAGDFLDVLDSMVGFASRGLLLPADTLLGKLARLV
ncbi:MAG TPA: DUF5995 family protein [Gaiellaceae bacterium]|nr:DUF5995 family protein [Gaiellaceae bacterium]